MDTKKIPGYKIAQAKAAIVDVIDKYIGLTKSGSEYEACCPFHDEKSPSFKVNPQKQFFYCFGCGNSGDAIDFVATYENISFTDAVAKITGGSQAGGKVYESRAAREVEPDIWQPISPVPEMLEKKPMSVFNRRKGDGWERMVASAFYEYHNAKGELIGYTVRFPQAGGGKDIIPQVCCVNTETGEMAWRWRSFAEPRPLYGLDKLAQYPNAQVMVVEGEKKADAGQLKFMEAGVPLEKLVLVGWPGGSKAIDKVDWSPLFGRKVGLWPDADQKVYKGEHPQAGELIPFIDQIGTQAMLAIFDKLAPHCQGIKFIVPPQGVPDGWDVADEFPAGLTITAHARAASMPAEEVRARFAAPKTEPAPPVLEAAVLPAEVEQAAIPPEYLVSPDPEDEVVEVVSQAKEAMPDYNDEHITHLVNNEYFSILGFDKSTFYVFQQEKQQVMELTAASFSEIGLSEIAPTHWWEDKYFQKGGGIPRKVIADQFFRVGHRVGIYDTARVRGRGAWVDKSRYVFHHGDSLSVDGKRVAIGKIDSGYVYPRSQRLASLDNNPLSTAEGERILQVCQMARWSMEASGPLLSGYIMLASVCGALKWRPHIWLTGAAGSGKSSILVMVHSLLSGIALFAQGNSTEAGIRQQLKADALPVLIDELESNNESERKRVEGLLAMIRQSSSESYAQTYKGSASGDSVSYLIRSMFCLSSINTLLDKKADIDRLTKLSLLSPVKNGPSNWEQMRDEMHKLATEPDMPSRLLSRAVSMLPTIHHNIAVFVKAGAKFFGTQRDGDQFGTLMAGAWSLISDEPVTEVQAMIMLKKFNWKEHIEDHDQDDARRALDTVLSSKIRVGTMGELTVYELIRDASIGHRISVSIDQAIAENTLRRYGIIVESKCILVGITAPNLVALVKDAPFATDIRGQLLRVPGADRHPKLERYKGAKTRDESIPLDVVLGNASADETDPI